MSDIHALVGAYAVDAVDDIERAQFERHLAGCPACRVESDGLREAAFLLSSMAVAIPPASLKADLLSEIKTVRPLPPLVEHQETAPARPTTGDSTSPGRRHWFPRLVAAAALVATVGTGAALIEQPWQDGSGSPTQLTASEQVLGASDARRMTQSFEDGSKATLVRSRSVGRAVVVTKGLPQAPSGKVYQMWLKNNRGAMVPAGVLPRDSDQTFVLDGDAATATGAGITIEPVGGSEVPTSDPIALYEFPDSVEQKT